MESNKGSLQAEIIVKEKRKKRRLQSQKVLLIIERNCKLREVAFLFKIKLHPDLTNNRV